MERNSVHGNLVYATVVKLVAFAEEVRARLRIGNDGDHARRRANDAIETERADLQASLARRKILAGVLIFLAVDERLKGSRREPFSPSPEPCTRGDIGR